MEAEQPSIALGVVTLAELETPEKAAKPEPAGLDQALGESRTFNKDFKVPEKTYSDFYTGIDLLSEEEQQKRKARAAKFGIAETDPFGDKHSEMDAEEEAKLSKRRARFGVVDAPPDDRVDLDKSKTEKVDLSHDRRPIALHICGTWLSSRKDRQVLSFFGMYGPSYLEWIDLYSANVVFADAANCLRALCAMSSPPRLSQMTEEQKAVKEDKCLNDKELQLWLWRPALCTTKQESLLMRMASVDDVKVHPGQRKGFKQYAQIVGMSGGQQRSRAQRNGQGRGGRGRGGPRDEEMGEDEEYPDDVEREEYPEDGEREEGQEEEQDSGEGGEEEVKVKKEDLVRSVQMGLTEAERKARDEAAEAAEAAEEAKVAANGIVRKGRGFGSDFRSRAVGDSGGFRAGRKKFTVVKHGKMTITRKVQERQSRAPYQITLKKRSGRGKLVVTRRGQQQQQQPTEVKVIEEKFVPEFAVSAPAQTNDNDEVVMMDDSDEEITPLYTM